MSRGILTALGAFLAAGCLDALDPLDPEVGALQRQRCVNQDSDVENRVSFSQDVLPIFRGEAAMRGQASVGCGCHQPSNPNPIGLEQAGLDLSSFSALRSGGINSQSDIVIPAEPCNSVLLQKLSAAPPFGVRMPFNGPPFLDSTSMQRIADWIAEGARDN